MGFSQTKNQIIPPSRANYTGPTGGLVGFFAIGLLALQVSLFCSIIMVFQEMKTCNGVRHKLACGVLSAQATRTTRVSIRSFQCSVFSERTFGRPSDGAEGDTL
jgi:hypothetical protein